MFYFIFTDYEVLLILQLLYGLLSLQLNPRGDFILKYKTNLYTNINVYTDKYIYIFIKYFQRRFQFELLREHILNESVLKIVKF